ncbi:N-acetyltransferase [Cohnella endophytica]|uniref:N-acetyltransferase n=1 Tax=Cohnella endophytica TaxID=2419778 RepID=UPI00389954BF
MASRYRGGHIARDLLRLVVDDARKQDKRIIPTCSYALAQFKRHAEYGDVWQK